MPTLTTLKTLDFEDALEEVEPGGAFVDLRPVDQYLDVHIPGSLSLLYEFGPGMPSRARDCIPLQVPLVLLDLGHGDVAHAAASLRGKGFNVLGSVTDGLNAWAARCGHPASTEVVRGNRQGRRQGPKQLLILDVGDPGAGPVQDALRIPIERLWGRAHEFGAGQRVVIAAGKGVRAALAVGMLERAGVTDIVFWVP